MKAFDAFLVLGALSRFKEPLIKEPLFQAPLQITRFALLGTFPIFFGIFHFWGGWKDRKRVLCKRVL